MIPKLETINIRPVQLTAPEFTRKAFVLDYETLVAGMEANRQPALRYALFLRDAVMRQRNEDKVQIRNVRIVECAICTECGGFVDLFNESHLSEGVERRRYFHIECWNARQSEYARLEDEGE